jgi:hypothetical protein
MLTISRIRSAAHLYRKDLKFGPSFPATYCENPATYCENKVRWCREGGRTRTRLPSADFEFLAKTVSPLK